MRVVDGNDACGNPPIRRPKRSLVKRSYLTNLERNVVSQPSQTTDQLTRGTVVVYLADDDAYTIRIVRFWLSLFVDREPSTA